jgi:hypothetical protein
VLGLRWVALAVTGSVAAAAAIAAVVVRLTRNRTEHPLALAPLESSPEPS